MSRILQLPAEVLFLILELLPKRDIRSLRAVSRRISRVAAHYQFGTVILRDPNGRQRIKKAANMLGSYLERTRALQIHAKLPIKRELDDATLNGILSRPNILNYLSLSHHIDEQLLNTLTLRQLPRFGRDSLPKSALNHLTHLRLTGIRLSDPTVLGSVPNLQELSLDLGCYLGHVKDAYSQSDTVTLLDMCGASHKLKLLTISVDDASPSLLDRIVKRLPHLETLHLVGSDNNGFLPAVAVYTRDVTDSIYSYTHILSGLRNLRCLSLPYFLSDPLLPEWHATHNEHNTQTTFYYPPPSELLFAAQATAPPALNGGLLNDISVPADGLVPTHVYFPAIREACETLREACPMLENISWCVPSACYNPQVAVIGPFALKVITWQYRPFIEEEQSMVGGDMDEDSVMGLGEPSQHGVWAVGERWRSDSESELAY